MPHNCDKFENPDCPKCSDNAVAFYGKISSIILGLLLVVIGICRVMT